ncbi:MAG: PepSY domain-containing protein, partial [Planctomycetes bacterium]|nr:PepSY domain-containing protein [Planctomycetota bacterium]
EAEYAALLKDTKISLSEGIEKGLAEAKEGIVYKAELEGDKTVHWAVDVSKGAKVLAVDIDAKTGGVVGTDLEDADQSKLAKSAKITILKAIEVALKKTPGKAVSAVLKLNGEDAEFDVKILAKDKLKAVKVDAQSGEIITKKAAAKKEAAPAAKVFTDSFAVEAGDWASTGRNTYWILEPGYFQIFEGKEDGKDVKITINVLPETRKIDGVETRVVEEKLFENGQIAEIARDYFAFSKKTQSVYYFGEDVDNYKNGKVDNHAGSWISGEKGARYGLMMPGINLLGARYHQEIAPGVGMDRAEIVSLRETVETPPVFFSPQDFPAG